jgi:nickel superoxide dismutase
VVELVETLMNCGRLQRSRGSRVRRPGVEEFELWVLWTDYFKPPHFEKYPQLHTLVNEATKLAGAGGTKASLDADAADQLLAKIDEIAEIFWETKKA